MRASGLKEVMASLTTLRSLGLPRIRKRLRHRPLSCRLSTPFPATLGGRRRSGMWRAPCSSTCIVLSRSGALSAIAIALIVAILTATGSTLSAQGAQPEVCAMQHDVCHHTAKIAQCCCHASDATHQGGPIESRVQLTVDPSPYPVALSSVAFADTSEPNLQVLTALPSASRAGLATHFAPLLI